MLAGVATTPDQLSLQPERERKLASRGGGWAQSSQAYKLDINVG